jgi:hypothetical protein
LPACEREQAVERLPANAPVKSEFPVSSKHIHWPHVFTVGGAGIIVATEVIALTWAAGWAIGGLLDLPRIFALGFEIVGAGVGLSASFYFIRAALRVEPVMMSKEELEQRSVPLCGGPDEPETECETLR